MSGGAQKVLLGKVVATHGIKGQLRVVPYSGETDTIVALKTVILRGPKGEEETFAVTAAAAHGRKMLLGLRDLVSINQVQHLVGRELYARRDQLPELEPGEYYWCDLLGLRVVTDRGETLGTVADIIATGSNDVYVVRDGEREYLIPALEDVVLQVNLDDGVMTVSPPEGLFDL
jgi:16S rRNA processing protein RimM